MWIIVLIGFYAVAIACLFFCRRPIPLTIVVAALATALLVAVLKLAGGAV